MRALPVTKKVISRMRLTYKASQRKTTFIKVVHQKHNVKKQKGREIQIFLHKND